MTKIPTLRAAVYARKSTEQDVTADAKSVTRQTDLAREFVQSKGWRLVEEFADDGISGRLRTKLVQRNRMLAAAMNDQFDVLVVRDLDRLSRNDEELPGLVYTLRDAGVEVWCYADGQRVDTKTALSRLQLNIRSYSGTAETEKASERTREQKRSRYATAPNVDGKVYGYVNVGEPKQRRREIVPKQAAMVKRIFEMSADGQGLLRIAKTLNAERIPSPTGRGWATTGIREMLRRDLYRGVSVYGKTRWEWRDGGKFKVDVPEEDWLRVPAPDLRIISDSLWQRVQARQEETRKMYPGRRTDGTLAGRREGGLIVSQYPLAGFLRCGECGGNLIVTARSGRGGVKKYYICTTAHHRRGTCSNVKGVPYEALTDAVLAEFKGNFLNPITLGQILMIELAEREAAPQAAKEEAEALRKDIAKLDRELARALEIALAGEGEAKTVADVLRAKEREKSELQAKLEHLDGIQQAADAFDLAEWFKETSELVADTKNFLESRVDSGRRLLRRCLATPFTVSPDGEGGWTFLGEGRFVPSDLSRLVRHEATDNPHYDQRRVQGRVNAGRNSDPPKVVPPEGFARLAQQPIEILIAA